MAEWGRRNDEAVDDFDDFDPTPYDGGYDIHLTFGRPIPPSEETCYPPNADSSSGVDYGRPSYYGSAQPSEEEPQDSRYGRRPSGYGDDRYEAEERPSHESGYGRRPEASEVQSYGYGYEEPKPKPYREEQSEDYEGGYGERPRYGQRRDEEEGSGENSDEEKEERRRYRRHDYGDD